MPSSQVRTLSRHVEGVQHDMDWEQLEEAQGKWRRKPDGALSLVDLLGILQRVLASKRLVIWKINRPDGYPGMRMFVTLSGGQQQKSWNQTWKLERSGRFRSREIETRMRHQASACPICPPSFARHLKAKMCGFAFRVFSPPSRLGLLYYTVGCGTHCFGDLIGASGKQLQVGV